MHAPLTLKSGSDDPQITETTCKLPIDGIEFRKYETRARQDASYDSCKKGDKLRKQAALLVKNMGRAQVDTGYYETMYDRLLKASQAREGIIEEVDKYEKANEDYIINKLLKQNKE